MEKEEIEKATTLSGVAIESTPVADEGCTHEDWRARQDRIIAQEQAKRVRLPMGPLIAAILLANGITIVFLYLFGVIHK